MNFHISVIVFGFIFCPGLVHAQSLSATAIEIDIAENDTEELPMLIAAYIPQSEIAPQLDTSAPGASQAAVTVSTGLPAPSIILGRVAAGQEAVFGIESLLPDTIAQIGFDYSDLEARIALRTNEPVLFRKLIEQGYVDPPVEQLNVVLQTELARMNCYRSGIDGAWGPGSRRSVGSYFDEVEDAGQPDQQPSMDLFRQIILREDVSCPTPIAAAPRAPRQTTTPRRNTATAQPTRRTTTQPAPAPKPRAVLKPKISSGAGIGVFR